MSKTSGLFASMKLVAALAAAAICALGIGFVLDVLPLAALEVLATKVLLVAAIVIALIGVIALMMRGPDQPA